MNNLRHVISIVSFLLFALVAIGNWSLIIDYYWKRFKKVEVHHSLIYFIGPICFTLGFFLLPLKMSPYLFLLILLDPGTVLSVIGLPWLIIVFIADSKPKNKRD